MEEMFDIEKFNVISDEENYYFFRSLEPGDIKDLEEGNIKDENGKYIRLRTDRERWEETHNLTPRWNAESQVTLEEMYNHIKTPYSLETNCISLSSNANVARTYGETFSDKYVMIKVPKKSKLKASTTVNGELGEGTITGEIIFKKEVFFYFEKEKDSRPKLTDSSNKGSE